MSLKTVEGAYSADTNTHYPTWEALVEAEAEGYLVIAIVSSEKQTWPWVQGPYPDKREANNARARARNKFKKDIQSPWVDPNLTASFFVRPLWKSKV